VSSPNRKELQKWGNFRVDGYTSTTVIEEHSTPRLLLTDPEYDLG
jgi:hypothetical protein